MYVHLLLYFIVHGSKFILENKNLFGIIILLRSYFVPICIRIVYIYTSMIFSKFSGTRLNVTTHLIVSKQKRFFIIKV